MAVPCAQARLSPCGQASTSGRSSYHYALQKGPSLPAVRVCSYSLQQNSHALNQVQIGSLTNPKAKLSFAGYQHSSLRRATATRVFPFDLAWAPNVSVASLAPQLFAASLFPYLAFLYYLTKCGQAPRLTLGGFYFLLFFVFATIPAGIYAKVQYGTSLANVDWLHGAAESLLTVTNLLIVLGLRQGIREAEAKKASTSAAEKVTASAVLGSANKTQVSEGGAGKQ